MKDIEALRLARVMDAVPCNINVPSDPEYALAAMETVLRRTEKPLQGDFNVSGYHPTRVSAADFQSKIDDYEDEKQQIEDVVWFFEAGNSVIETARFFKLGYRVTVQLLKKGRAI
jgi:hypothetical protein